MKYVMLVALIVLVIVGYTATPSTGARLDRAAHCYYYDAATGSFVWGPCPTPAPTDCYVYLPSAGTFVWEPCELIGVRRG